jgi:hypothetical protein
MVDLGDAPLSPGDAVCWHLDDDGRDVAIPAIVVSGTPGEINAYEIRLDGLDAARFFTVDGSELSRSAPVR